MCMYKKNKITAYATQGRKRNFLNHHSLKLDGGSTDIVEYKNGVKLERSN